MNDESYDAIVAGGGPAGLSAAQVVASAGLRVLVVEKRAAIGEPVRSSGGSFIADLAALGVPDHLYHPLRTCRFLGPAAESSFTTRRPIACVLDVRALYQYLAQQAIASGAMLRLRTQVLAVERYAGDAQMVTMRDHTGVTQRLRSSLVIDATGFASTLAAQAGLHAHYRRAGVGAELDLYAPAYPQDTCVLAVGSRIAPHGYAWAFPYGNGRVRAGIGVLKPDTTVDPADYLDTFVRDYPPLRDALAGASPVESHTGVIPCEGPSPTLVADGLITVGDAAGQASSLAGEGIRFAMHAGRLAGRVGADAIGRQDVSSAALGAYPREWERRFGRDHRRAYAITNRLYQSSDDQWDAAIRLLGSAGSAAYVRLMATDLSPQLLIPLAAAAVRHPRALRQVLGLLRPSPRSTRPRP